MKSWRRKLRSWSSMLKMKAKWSEIELSTLSVKSSQTYQIKHPMYPGRKRSEVTINDVISKRKKENCLPKMKIK